MADVGEKLLGLDYLQQSMAVLDFGEMTLEVRGSVVLLQEDSGDVGECAVSVKTHKAHTTPPPEACHRCRLNKELEGESLGSPVTRLPVSEETVVDRTAASPETEDDHAVVADVSDASWPGARCVWRCADG